MVESTELWIMSKASLTNGQNNIGPSRMHSISCSLCETQVFPSVLSTILAWGPRDLPTVRWLIPEQPSGTPCHFFFTFCSRCCASFEGLTPSSASQPGAEGFLAGRADEEATQTLCLSCYNTQEAVTQHQGLHHQVLEEPRWRHQHFCLAHPNKTTSASFSNTNLLSSTLKFTNVIFLRQFRVLQQFIRRMASTALSG